MLPVSSVWQNCRKPRKNEVRSEDYTAKKTSLLGGAIYYD
jgi:hypothetical protein